MRSLKLSALVLVGSIIGGMVSQPAIGYIRGALAQALSGCALAATCSFTGVDGTLQFQVGYLSGAAESYQVLGGLTGQGASMIASGASTNINANITTKGTGCMQVGSGAEGPLFNSCANYAVNSDGAAQANPAASGSVVNGASFGNTHYGFTAIGGTNNRTQPMVNMTPTTSSQTCSVSDMSWDTSFVYVCTAANTWKRATLAAF